MINQKSTLARLLANENITVQQGNYQTAFFDVQSRVLGLPLWKDMGKDVYDMLVGHEVSHALFTPANFNEYLSEGIPHSWLNIVEDVRIEKLILRKYPGLVGNFKRGYVHLMKELDLFGVKDTLDQLHTLSFMDRLNLHAKARDLLEVPFADDELPFVAQAKACETYEDVVQCCRDIQAWLNEKAEETQTGDAEESENAKPEEGQGDGEMQASDDNGDDSDEADTDGAGDATGDNSEEGDAPAPAPTAGSDVDDDDGDLEVGVNDPTPGASDQEASTDLAWNENTTQLLDGDGNVYAMGMTKAQADACTVPYEAVKIAREMRRATFEQMTGTKLEFPEAAYAEFQKETKQVVNLMVKEFEMRKAAYRSARARTSTRGTLDVNKLHRYKYDDQLFKQVQQLADAKSHGMMMLIDYSGSMSASLPAVQRQLLALMMFCKRVAIPFEVYAFTTAEGGEGWRAVQDKVRAVKPSVTSIDISELGLVELFSSSMSKRDYTEASRQLFWQTCYHSHRSPVASEFEELGSTPLNDALLAMQYKIKAFRQKHAVQKMNFITLTDGESNSFRLTTGDDAIDRRLRGSHILIEVDGKMIQVPARWSRDGAVTTKLIKAIESLGCSTMNYYIGYSNRDVNDAIRSAITVNGWNENYRQDQAKLKREIRNTGVAVLDDNCGYQRRFIMQASDASMQGEIEEINVNSDMTAKKIAKAFGKSNGSKKKSRVVTQKFAELVA